MCVCVSVARGWEGGLLMLHSAEWRRELGGVVRLRGGRRLGVSVPDERMADNPHDEHLGAEMAVCVCVCERRRLARRGKVRFAASRYMNPSLPVVLLINMM